MLFSFRFKVEGKRYWMCTLMYATSQKVSAQNLHLYWQHRTGSEQFAIKYKSLCVPVERRASWKGSANLEKDPVSRFVLTC